MIRGLQSTDLDALCALEQQTQLAPWSRAQLRSCFQPGYLQRGIAVVDKPAAPTLRGYYIALVQYDALELLTLGVLPLSQGQGLGQQLLADLKRQAQVQQCPYIRLEVRRSNQKARTLYQKQGFELCGCRKNYYPARQPQPAEDALLFSYAVEKECKTIR